MTASPSPVQQVERLLGAPLVASTAERLAAFALDGHGPDLVAFPETPEQVAQLLALANSEGWAVVPWGGGHGMATGATPARYDVALSLARLETLGYEPCLVIPGYWSRQFGRMVEFDVAAFRAGERQQAE